MKKKIKKIINSFVILFYLVVPIIVRADVASPFKIEEDRRRESEIFRSFLTKVFIAYAVLSLIVVIIIIVVNQKKKKKAQIDKNTEEINEGKKEIENEKES